MEVKENLFSIKNVLGFYNNLNTPKVHNFKNGRTSSPQYNTTIIINEEQKNALEKHTLEINYKPENENKIKKHFIEKVRKLYLNQESLIKGYGLNKDDYFIQLKTSAEKPPYIIYENKIYANSSDLASLPYILGGSLLSVCISPFCGTVTSDDGKPIFYIRFYLQCVKIEELRQSKLLDSVKFVNMFNITEDQKKDFNERSAMIQAQQNAMKVDVRNLTKATLDKISGENERDLPPLSAEAAEKRKAIDNLLDFN